MRSIRCRFDVPEVLPDCSIPSEVRHNIFLIVREALNNVVKHSRATEVKFRLRATSTLLSMDFEDNGRGFLAGDGPSSGNGLQNMEKRMKTLGGIFRLVTSPGAGTSIHVEVPVKASFIK
jgi:signal transduction histidine kinase